MLRQRKVKQGILITVDFLLIMLSYFVAVVFRFYFRNDREVDIVSYYKDFLPQIIMAAVIYIIIFAVYKQYKSIWSIAGVEEFVLGVTAVATGFVVNAGISLLEYTRISLMITLITSVLVTLLCNGVRVAWRIVRRALISVEIKNTKGTKRVLIVGAGAAGSLVANEFKKNPQAGKVVKAFIDDNNQKIGSYITGVKVVGNRKDIPEIVESKLIDEVIIAIADLDSKELKDIINICKKTKAVTKVMPGLSEMIDGKFTLSKIRDVDVKDLLGREQVKLDKSGIASYIENKVVLVTGGGGSIGSELCRQIANFMPKQLIILDIYENNAYEIQNELIRNYKELDLKTLIASVRDKNRMEAIFKEYSPDVVFHAAAHKHVPLMEDSPGEAIKNNVIGTLNTAELASKYKVERFVLISTDKAVNPTNVMGATKRLCEMIIQAIDKESKTEFVAVRFGNVLGSNGSVVPLFKKQIAEGGPVTLTHKDITRYFMLIPEASQLVLQAGAYAKGGEIFVLDMGEPVKIYDLAENLIKLSGYEPHKEMEIRVTGLRPGEKLYEELLMNEEGLTETNHKMIFIGLPGDFNLNSVREAINELMFLSTLGNIKLLKNKLKEVVPTYVDPESINEVAISK